MILQKISLELISSNFQFYQKRILVIGGQYVNKQSQDLRYYKKNLSNSSSFRLVERYDKTTALKIPGVLWTL